MPDNIYHGNPKLKDSHVSMEFTKEQMAEIIRCSNDPIYFIKNYVKIVSLDEGLVPFNLFPFQEKMIETIHQNREVITKIPRQSGKSTTLVAMFYIS